MREIAAICETCGLRTICVWNGWVHDFREPNFNSTDTAHEVLLGPELRSKLELEYKAASAAARAQAEREDHKAFVRTRALWLFVLAVLISFSALALAAKRVPPVILVWVVAGVLGMLKVSRRKSA